MGSVFVHHDGALGDVLLSLSCLHHLRSRYGSVHLASRPDAARLLSATGAVDEASSSTSAGCLPLYSGRGDEQLRRRMAGFDRAYIFSASREPAVYHAVRTAVPETEVVATMPPAGDRTHVTEFRLAQIGAPAMDADRRVLAVPCEERDRAASLLADAGRGEGQRLFALHPGSGGSAKCWPLERYLALAAAVRSAFDAFIVVITGPDEREDLVHAVRSWCRSGPAAVPVCGLDLLPVAALLSLVDAFVGNDSGISHLAAAAGCPCVSLFGPTDPALWRPRGRSVRIISSGSLAGITTGRVWEAVSALLAGGVPSVVAEEASFPAGNGAGGGEPVR